VLLIFCTIKLTPLRTIAEANKGLRLC